MKVGKPKSKRVPVRLRHKIEKSSASKQRKERKQAKKNPQWVSRLKKDPGIPSMFPYKAKVLAEIEEARRRKEEEVQHKKEVAKAQRNGTVVAEASAEVAGENDELLEDVDDVEEGDEDEMDVQDTRNPMAALLASAQARANTYTKEEDEDGEDDEADEDEWTGLDGKAPVTKTAQPVKKSLPKQALADPIKAVSALMERMQHTQDGIQRLIDHYQIPAVPTSSSDLHARFLVEVARKRGRLGRGGVPNLHAAALTVLSDLNDERLQLPAPEVKKTTVANSAAGLGQVQVVSTMAAPFTLEGLWGDNKPVEGGGEMVVET